MSILAHNIYRLFARDLERYEHLTAQSIYEKFILNDGDINITRNQVTVKLKKKRHLPLILENMQQFQKLKYSWLNNKKIIFEGESYS